MTRAEANAMCCMAMGRLFRMASRPPEPGDANTYHAVRSVMMECAPIALGHEIDLTSHAPNYVRDRHKVAQGD